MPAGLFEAADGDSAEHFYNAVRIPINHGLLRRYVTQYDETKAFVEKLIGISMPTTSHDLEDVVEDFGVPQVDIVLGIIERNSTLWKTGSLLIGVTGLPKNRFLSTH